MRWGLTVLPLLLPLGCADRPPPGPGGVLTPTGFSPAEVVARVDGRPILAADLRRQMQRGEPRDAALRALIEEELLAGLVLQRGALRDPEVLHVQRKAMVNALLLRWRADFTKEDIPRDLLLKAYESKKHFFVHPELKHVKHILVSTTPQAPDADRLAVRALAEQIRKQAAARPLTPDAFAALGAQVRAAHPDRQIIVEDLHTGAQGYTVRPFADAAFALPADGAISPVVETRFGYHVIYLVSTVPPENKSLADVEGQMREKLMDYARREVFLRWLRQLSQRGQVEEHPEVLDRLQTASAAER